MMMLENVTSAANKFFSEIYESEYVFKIIPIKGYLTTNVYKIDVQIDDVKVSYFVKESSRLNNDKFNGFIKNEYLNTKYVSDKFVTNENLNTVMPIKYYADHNLFFMHEIKGQRLDLVIKKFVYFQKHKQFIFIVNLCRQWLLAFHAIEPIENHVKDTFKNSEMGKIEFIKNRSFINIKENDRAELLLMYDKIEKLLNSLEISEYDFAYKHNDFAPWNIMFDDVKITTYDFSDIKIDCKYYDLIYFIHSIEKLFRYYPFKKRIISLTKSEMMKGLDIKEDVMKYYFMFFYLQDIESYLRKIKLTGVKKYAFKILYKMAVYKIKRL